MKKLALMLALVASAALAITWSSQVSAAPQIRDENKIVVTDEMVDAKIDARLHQLLSEQLLRRVGQAR